MLLTAKVVRDRFETHTGAPAPRPVLSRGPHGMAGWWQEKDGEKGKAEADLLQSTARAVPALWRMMEVVSALLGHGILDCHLLCVYRSGSQ